MAAKILLTMPLHAITEKYGEPGLRDRRELEIESSPADGRPVLRAARALAAELHAGDRRTREPYLNHLLRVAVRIISYYGVRDVDVIVAALLHDAVEDHPDELAGLPACTPHRQAGEAAVAELARPLNPPVAALVRPVTH